MIAPEHVHQRWRRLAYSVAAALLACLTAYLAVRVVRILQGDVVLVTSREPHFGHLPNFKFTRLPAGHSETEFGFFNVKAENGLELQPPKIAERLGFKVNRGISTNKNMQKSMDLTNISVTVENESISFKTSELTVPHFIDIMSDERYRGSMPQPKISFAVLFKSKSIDRILEGFYMIVEDPVSGREAYYGGVAPAKETLVDGYAHSYVYSCTKEVHEQMMTKLTLTKGHIWSGFQDRVTNFRMRTLYDFKQRMINCSDNEWSFLPVGKGGYRANLSGAAVGCYDGWRLLHVVVNFPQEAVVVYQWQGQVLQLASLLSQVGGLWTVCTSLFLLCFIRKNQASEFYKQYEERTWVGEAVLGGGEPLAKPDGGGEKEAESDASSNA